MSLDPPFTLPPGVPAWAHELYDWVSLVQDQVDEHAAQISRNAALVKQLREKIVAQQDELDQVVAQLQAADARIDALIASQAAVAADLRTQIADLQAQLAAGTSLDFTGLHAIADALDADAPPTV